MAAPKSLMPNSSAIDGRKRSWHQGCPESSCVKEAQLSRAHFEPFPLTERYVFRILGWDLWDFVVKMYILQIKQLSVNSWRLPRD